MGRNPVTDKGLELDVPAKAGQNGTEGVAAGPEAGTHQEHNAGLAGSTLDPDLRELVLRWDQVPMAVRTAILTIVSAFRGG